MRTWTLAILWTLSLIVVAAIAGRAQSFRSIAPDFLIENEQVISGDDVGFRIERTQDGLPVGRVVIKVDGKWVNTGAAR
jgi:hypothetical protein